MNPSVIDASTDKSISEEVLLGAGTYSKVFASQDQFAVKVLKFDSKYLRWCSLNDLIFPASLNHPNIIQNQSISFVDNYLHITMDRFEGDLRRVILKSLHGVNYHPPKIRPLFQQMIAALLYLDQQNIIHHDIKPENFLIKDGRVVLTDFGMSVFRHEISDIHFKCYTESYRAPEIYAKHPYTQKADIWALACTFYEIATSYNLFGNSKDGRALITPSYVVIQRIFTLTGRPTGSVTYSRLADYFPYRKDFTTLYEAKVWDPSVSIPRIDDFELNDVLIRMLNPNPYQRLSIYEVNRHPFFNGEDVPELTVIQKLQRMEPVISIPTVIDEDTLARCKLSVDWICDVTTEFKFSDRARFLSFYLFNRIFWTEKITLKEIQLYLAACMALAQCINQYGDAFNLYHYVRVCCGQYTEQRILETCKKILEITQYQLLVTSPFDYLEIADHPRATIKFARILLYFSLPIPFLFQRPNLVELCLKCQDTTDLTPDCVMFRRILREWYGSKFPLLYRQHYPKHMAWICNF